MGREDGVTACGEDYSRTLAEVRTQHKLACDPGSAADACKRLVSYGEVLLIPGLLPSTTYSQFRKLETYLHQSHKDGRSTLQRYVASHVLHGTARPSTSPTIAECRN
jgi:hypothetical protein